MSFRYRNITFFSIFLDSCHIYVHVIKVITASFQSYSARAPDTLANCPNYTIFNIHLVDLLYCLHFMLN